MNRTENTEAQRMTFWEKIYLPEIARGMGLTFRELFKPKFTRQYPEERFEPTGSSWSKKKKASVVSLAVYVHAFVLLLL